MEQEVKLCYYNNHIEFSTLDDALEFTKEFEYFVLTKTTVKEKGIYENEPIYMVCYDEEKHEDSV